MSAGFMPGLRAALTSGAVAEFAGAVIAFAFIHRDSLHAKG
jgi:hypothetical protein